MTINEAMDYISLKTCGMLILKDVHGNECMGRLWAKCGNFDDLMKTEVKSLYINFKTEEAELTVIEEE